ncbi:hypothetical protein GQQ23_09375 [Pantoea agglomerans]|uniref:hypothetical protein n=1 Tax=Enterobacter agglomerans TaxID=549 RepID=UPI0013C9BA07|nr:hypothetical protein [Pantoea agglomerans]NEG62545.1 hypothetical protein [Pantoea agglomerans]
MQREWLMKRIKWLALYTVFTLFYLIVIPEIIFRTLSEDAYMKLGEIVNPFQIFPSTVNALFIAIIISALLLAWLTIKLIKRVTRRGNSTL